MIDLKDIVIEGQEANEVTKTLILGELINFDTMVTTDVVYRLKNEVVMNDDRILLTDHILEIFRKSGIDFRASTEKGVRNFYFIQRDYTYSIECAETHTSEDAPKEVWADFKTLQTLVAEGETLLRKVAEVVGFTFFVMDDYVATSIIIEGERNKENRRTTRTTITTTYSGMGVEKALISTMFENYDALLEADLVHMIKAYLYSTINSAKTKKRKEEVKELSILLDTHAMINSSLRPNLIVDRLRAEYDIKLRARNKDKIIKEVYKRYGIV